MPDDTGVASRRTALKTLGLAAAAMVPGRGFAQAPAVRKKVSLAFWTWSDNPSHQKMLVDSVDAFNKSQSFITVALDAGSRTMEVQQKVLVAFAAGAAPDIAGAVQTHIQDYFNAGILWPIDPLFQKWDQKADYFPNILAFMRSKPEQPILYMPQRILPYILYYRADWFDAAGLKPPATYDAFIAAARQITKPGEHAGYAMRGVDYYAVQPIEPIWGSAGVQFVTADGKVDFADPTAVTVTEKWIGMFTKDKSAQASAISDGYPQLFSLMERGGAAMWIYGTHANPQLNAALGDRIQGVPTPNAGQTPRMLANPEGDFITTSCKEKEAAFEFLQFMGSADPVGMLAISRGYLPVRKSLSNDPRIQGNRFFKIATDHADTWWTPPFSWQNWANYQNKIAPYWQQALRQEITPKQWNEQAAALLRGEG
ncbi:MAG: extracellular solute-binding protein [Acidisphaera sp.]|nr:extracellular solute-binding protein [Acidisphaera sp.]